MCIPPDVKRKEKGERGGSPIDSGTAPDTTQAGLFFSPMSRAANKTAAHGKRQDFTICTNNAEIFLSAVMEKHRKQV